jgi:hypothetical protein
LTQAKFHENIVLSGKEISGIYEFVPKTEVLEQLYLLKQGGILYEGALFIV